MGLAVIVILPHHVCIGAQINADGIFQNNFKTQHVCFNQAFLYTYGGKTADTLL